MTFQGAKQWCDSLSDEKSFELVTPIGDQEEEFFLDYAEHFWIGPGRIERKFHFENLTKSSWLTSYLDRSIHFYLKRFVVNPSKGLRNDSQEVQDFLNLVQLSDQDLQ